MFYVYKKGVHGVLLLLQKNHICVIYISCFNVVFVAFILIKSPGIGYPDQGECWACERSAVNTVKCNSSAFFELELLYKQNMGKPPINLAKILYDYYEKNIRGPANLNLREGQTLMPEWQKKDIFEHFSSHTNDPETRLAQAAHMTNRIQRDIYRYGMWEANVTDPSITKPSDRGIDNWVKIGNYQLRLYNSDTTNMMLSVRTGTSNAPQPVSDFIDRHKPSYGGEHPFMLTHCSI